MCKILLILSFIYIFIYFLDFFRKRVIENIFNVFIDLEKKFSVNNNVYNVLIVFLFKMICHFYMNIYYSIY